MVNNDTEICKILRAFLCARLLLVTHLFSVFLSVIVALKCLIPS